MYQIHYSLDSTVRCFILTVGWSFTGDRVSYELYAGEKSLCGPFGTFCIVRFASCEVVNFWTRSLLIHDLLKNFYEVYKPESPRVISNVVRLIQ